jgi:D-3-phosphoglycerate dehydrogenase
MARDAAPVAVTSRSFSRNARLREELLSRYSDVRFNDDGRSLAGADLIRFLADRRGAITGLERIDDDVLRAVPSLSVVSRLGVGVDMLDLAAFERRGVQVATTDGANSRSVAELTLLLILGVLRRVPEVGASLRSGRWEQPRGRELTGRTVGIIGLGHVGREVARLVGAFGCEVLAADAYPSEVPAAVQLVDLDRLLGASDVVSLHAPLTADTTGLIGRRELALMKRGAVLVNTARGPLIDEAALLEALDRENLGGAGLDVLVDEPPIDRVLLDHRKVFATSHIGASTDEALYAMGRAAIDGLQRALSEAHSEQGDA